MELQNKLKDMCINRAYSLYGYNYPTEIYERLNAELDDIEKTETANIFLLLQKISEYSHLKGYDIMCAGRLAGSFAAFLGGISSINPLKPHYYCQYCKKIEFVSADYTDICYDLPDKQCTVCGHKLQKAGWNIPFEKSLSCFEICVAPEVYDEIIRKFSNTDSSIMINSFREKCAENKSVRLNILKSDALSLLGNLKKKVPINSGDINLSDFKILEFLSQSDNMHEILSLLNWDADCYKLNMKIHSFYDILHFISLANGKYRKEMPSDFPATGDDIMLYLMSQGIPAKYACSISLHASKGRLSQAEIDILKKEPMKKVCKKSANCGKIEITQEADFFMGRRKREPMSEGKKNIIAGLLQEYDIKTAKDIEDALKDLLGGTIQEMLESEMDEHLGYHEYERSDNPDYRNGKKTKKIRGNFGETEIEVPQDRDGTFEPKVVKKRQKDISGIEQKIISLYAKGMTTRQISETIEDIYGFEVSDGMVSDITDRLLPQIEDWQKRPLDEVYPIVFIDAVHFSVRDNGQIRKLAAYVILAVSLTGHWINVNKVDK